MPVLAIPAAGVALIVILVLIVLALVYFLVSTILALRAITNGLDEVISSVGEILEKSAPVNEVVNNINAQLDAGVDLLEGLLVKKAGLEDAVGLIDGLYPGAAAAGLRNFPESTSVEAPRIAEVYTKGTLTLARLGREAPDRHGQPGRPGAAQRRGRQPRGPAALPGRPPDGAEGPAAVSGHRHRRPGPVRTARRHRRSSPNGARRGSKRTHHQGAGRLKPRPFFRAPGILRSDRGTRTSRSCLERNTHCRLLRHSSMSARRAWRARSRR